MSALPLSGFIDEITLSDISRLLQSSRRTGRLALKIDTGIEPVAGSIYFDLGEIVDAQANMTSGLDAIKYLALFRRAAFDFLDAVIAPSRALTAYPTTELIQAMENRMQEARQIQELMPMLNQIPRYLGGTIPAGLELNAGELSLAMKAVKGSLTVQDLIRELNMDVTLVRYTVARLRAAGLMDVVEATNLRIIGTPAPAAPERTVLPEVPPLAPAAAEAAASEANSSQARYWRGRRIG